MKTKTNKQIGIGQKKQTNGEKVKEKIEETLKHINTHIYTQRNLIKTSKLKQNTYMTRNCNAK